MPISLQPVTAALCVALAALAVSLTGNAEVSQQDKDRAQSLLEELIPYRTAKGYGQVPAMIDPLVAKLTDAGFSADDIVRVGLDIDGDKTSGLIVRFPGSGNAGLKPVVFLAHMDVVDALPENWDTDPFVPQVIDGYLYGRGTQDNKFGVALLVSTFSNLKASGFTPQRDLVLAFAGDEETGMLTTREILKHPYVRDAEFALNSDAGSGEMTREGKAVSFSMQTSEKTYANFTLSTSNPGGHSSIPRPDNAIYDLARALTSIEKLEFPVQFNVTTRSMAMSVAKREGGEVGEALITLLHNPTDRAAIAVMKRYPQYAKVMWTTCIATMLEAGHAKNALPQNARGNVNCRILPDTGGVDLVRQVLSDTIGNDAVSIEQSGEAVESPSSPLREDVLATLQAGVAANYPGITLQPMMSSGGTEGRE